MSESVVQLTMYVSKAFRDPTSNEMRWACTSSDTDPDLYDDEMTLDLYKSFLSRIDKGVKVPVEYRSEFWEGGMPYISLAHYSDGNGKNVFGEITSIYLDGNTLKAKGVFYDTPLGNACFKSLEESFVSKSDENKIRISIGFLDYRHVHKSSGTEFIRKSVKDFCPECSKQYSEHGKLSGRRFVDGQLIHLALTRVPVNPRTLMEIDRSMTTKKEDAASIVGEELAEEVAVNDEVNPLKSLVTKSKDEDYEEEDEEMEEKDKKKKADEEKSLTDLLGSINSRLEAIEAKSLTGTQHVLDPILNIFKSAYDTVDKSRPENMKELESVWNQLADVVRSGFAGEDVAPAVKDSPEVVAELVKSQVEAAVRPLMEQIQMLSQQTQKPVEHAPETVQRGLTHVPNLVVNEPAVARSQEQKPASATPSLRDYVRKSVGLRN